MWGSRLDAVDFWGGTVAGVGGESSGGQWPGWGLRVRGAQFGRQEAWRGSPRPESPPLPLHRECP